MTAQNLQRGAAPVADLASLPVMEATSVIYFRHWSDSAADQSTLRAEFYNGLGASKGRELGEQFQLFCEMCFRHARRPLARHSIGCRCVGADEACFANLVASSPEADTEDAMMIATLIVKAEIAPLITGLTVDVGLALRQMQLALPRELTAARPSDTASRLH